MNPPNLHQRRYTFLCALRYGPIPFWQDLNQAWRTDDPDRLEYCIARWGIVDEWFISDAIVPTIQQWDKDPDLQNACLDPGYRWFFYAHPGDEVLPFEPAGTAGLPHFSGPLNDSDVMRLGSFEDQQKLHELAEFEGGPYSEMLKRFFKRIESEFPQVRRRGAHHKDWVEHKRYMRALAWNKESPQHLLLHAEWTALMWAGITPMEIAKRWRKPRLSKMNGQPEKRVSMAVRRFADSIGLTII